jgi:hypothetical protein
MCESARDAPSPAEAATLPGAQVLRDILDPLAG